METRKSEIFKVELAMVHDIIQSNYRFLYNTFMCFAGMREIVNQDEWVMSFTMLNEFLKTINAFSDPHLLEFPAIERICNEYFKKKMNETGDGMLRHEFIDILALIGYEKYGRSKLALAPLVAMRNFFMEEGFQKTIKAFTSPAVWRS